MPGSDCPFGKSIKNRSYSGLRKCSRLGIRAAYSSFHGLGNDASDYDILDPSTLRNLRRGEWRR